MSKDPREAALLGRLAGLEKAGHDDEDLAAVLGELVDYYWEAGDHQSAEVPMLRRLELLRHARGPRHTAVARCLHDLALLYDHLRRDAAVEDFATQAMTMWADIDGYANGHTLRMLELLARLYARQGRHEQLSTLLDTTIPEIERGYPRGYHDHSLAKLVELLAGDDRSAELRSFAGRVRALLD